jgi:hypothetical protein
MLDRGVSLNAHLSAVLRLMASGALSALACSGRYFPYCFCQNNKSGNLRRPVMDICGVVQFVMHINTKGCNYM